MVEITEVQLGGRDSASSIHHAQSRRPSDINERRRAALQDIDNASFSWYHARTCLVAGIGFFTDSYDIFAISIAAIMIGYIYGPHGALTANQELGIKVALPIGTFVGQLVFGWLADMLGRKRMYGLELAISMSLGYEGFALPAVLYSGIVRFPAHLVINGTFAQALCGQSGAVSIIGTVCTIFAGIAVDGTSESRFKLIVWRFLTGIGTGGDYPLSSVITSEFASTRMRGRMMTAVFSAQGWGTFAAALVSFIVIVIYKHPIEHGPPSVPDVDRCWRLVIGIGCIPGVIGLYFRLTIPETPRYTMDIERNIAQAAQDIELFYTKGASSAIPRFPNSMNDLFFPHFTGTYTSDDDIPVVRVDSPKATRHDFVHYFSKWENGKVLLGTAWSWFALDIAFHGLGLNSSIILGSIGFGAPSGIAAVRMSHSRVVWLSLRNISVGNMIISIAGLIPGFYVTMAVIDSWGRKPIQYMGFIFLTIILCCMGFGYDRMVSHGARGAFVALYCLANFFQNFGPNSTTFIIPGEVFPTRYRCTGHGISAASGKLGAIVAQISFSHLKDIGGPNKFVKHILEIFALFMLTGVFSTMLIPETMGRTLEDLSNENQESYIRGIRHPRGHDTTTVAATAAAAVPGYLVV